MSVIVRGVEMPKNCALCKFRGAGETWCPFTLQEVPGNTIPEDCPLGPVPKHGRLIDADVLKPYMLNEHYKYRLVYDANEVANVPTIIPAEPPKEEA